MKVLIFGLPGSGKTTLATSFADLINGVHINADTVRTTYNDWDFTLEGRIRQAQRMRYLSDGVVMATETARKEFAPDFTIWMDTIKEGRFEDTNALFETPDNVDYHVSKWFNDTHEALLPVINRYMGRDYSGL